MTENMMERLDDFEITEEIGLICSMIAFRRRLLLHHLGYGFFRSAELEAI
jgi:hypothetical protein